MTFNLATFFLNRTATTGDRLGRLMKHIFTQQSFYPVHPPPEDVPIDYAHYEEYARLTVKPHVFIAPSDMRYFIKVSWHYRLNRVLCETDIYLGYICYINLNCDMKSIFVTVVIQLL